jgi:peptide/nickel transport system ATP-binding protein
MGCNLLEVCNLSVRYLPEGGGPVLALENVSLALEAGQIVGVLGESGSGKSTLAAAILKLLPANAEASGSIFFRSQDLLQMPEKRVSEIRGRHAAMVPQDPASSLNPVMRIGTQIAEVLRAHLKLKREDRRRRVRELLQEVGLDDSERIAGSYPHQISGGQRQRVVIAQAIACRPSLLIADESTSKLEAPLQLQILQLVSGIVRQHNTSVLWITHHPATLAGFADRIVVMHKARVVEDGHANDVLYHAKHPYTRHLVAIATQVSSIATARAAHAD